MRTSACHAALLGTSRSCVDAWSVGKSRSPYVCPSVWSRCSLWTAGFERKKKTSRRLPFMFMLPIPCPPRTFSHSTWRSTWSGWVGGGAVPGVGEWALAQYLKRVSGRCRSIWSGWVGAGTVPEVDEWALAKILKWVSGFCRITLDGWVACVHYSRYLRMWACIWIYKTW